MPRLPDEEKRQRLAIAAADPDAVMSFGDWCLRNNISQATGHRIVKRGEGPDLVQLSLNRIGVTFRADKAWKESKRRVVPA
jgi:hypothetical protein